MADNGLGVYGGKREKPHLDSNRSLEAGQLSVRDGDEEGFQQNDGFPEASVEIVVSNVERLPPGGRIYRAPTGNLVRGTTELTA